MALTEEQIFYRLQNIISIQLNRETKDILTSSDFTEDLEADSLDVVELVMSFEEEFDVPIEDDVAGEMVTVQDAIDYILKVQSEG